MSPSRSTLPKRRASGKAVGSTAALPVISYTTSASLPSVIDETASSASPDATVNVCVAPCVGLRQRESRRRCVDDYYAIGSKETHELHHKLAQNSSANHHHVVAKPVLRPAYGVLRYARQIEPGSSLI